MKVLIKGLVVILLQLIPMAVIAQWMPAGDNLKSKWTKDVDVNNVLPEYPRPLMVRSQWANLNGLWKYAITSKTELKIPEKYDGDILVPFPLESSLSGVQRKLMPDELLWYFTEFEIPSDWKKKNVILNFGAIDWQSTIWINDIKVGEHTGGYTPFSFDITPFLNNKGKQKIVIKVYDPNGYRDQFYDPNNLLTEGFQSRGKQALNPRGAYYSAISGIWQTVWLEPVNKKNIADVKIRSDVDKSMLYIELKTTASSTEDWFEAVVMDNGKQITVGKSVAGEKMEVYIPDAKLWSPDSPFLYDLNINLHSNNEITDHVESYFAMRKISIRKGDREPTRIELNNEDYFNFGLLDQGYWPDGIYTAPTDDALKFDIQMTKDLGFNTIRKHWKIEPARWYYHCDKTGLLVWQDFPGGDQDVPHGLMEMERSPESERVFFLELTQMVEFLYSYPSVVCWVLFNERTGQFKTKKVVDYTRKLDHTRLIDAASGGNHFPVGDMIDFHFYPEPKLFIHDQTSGRATVQGEFGGIGLFIKDHTWHPEESWGYVNCETVEEVTDTYVGYGEDLLELIKLGISAAFYTQTTDIEKECNGMVTYDREVMKVDADRVREINLEISSSLQQETMPMIQPLFDHAVRDISICVDSDGWYYLTGTTANNPAGGHDKTGWWYVNEGIRVWKSRDLKKWEFLDLVWSLDKDATWARSYKTDNNGNRRRAVWAPEIFFMNDTFWLTYSMNYGGCGLLRSITGKAEGPYVDVIKEGPLTGEIDASLFQDDDGRIYFIFQNGKIARMKEDMTGLAEKPHLLKPDNSKHVGFEGAFLTKNNGRYILLGAEFNYHNDSLSTYDCMASVADHLDGPYSEKYMAIPHAGHNMIFCTPNGKWYSTMFGNDPKALFREKPGILPIEFDTDGRFHPLMETSIDATLLKIEE